jgi:hypothetical protein
MSSVLKCKEAVVKDLRKVQEIIDSYALDGVEPQLKMIASSWVLAMSFEDLDYDGSAFPLALHKRDCPAEEQYPPVPVDDDSEMTYDLATTAWEKQFDEKGKEGFLAFLRDLAPCLETPFLVLHLFWDSTGSSATTWLVLPETTEVEAIEIHLPN